MTNEKKKKNTMAINRLFLTANHKRPQISSVSIFGVARFGQKGISQPGAVLLVMVILTILWGIMTIHNTFG